MAKRSPLTNAVRRFFTENLTAKIVSLVAAIVLFSMVRGSEDAQRTVFSDVVAILPPGDSGKVLLSELPDRVRLTLQGSRSLLNSIRREDLEVQMDLTDTRLRYYYFDPAVFDLPAGVQIVQMAPASVPLTWADRIERRVPVEPQFVGTPEPGLSITEPVAVEPRRVLLRGPQNEVDPLASVDTQPIDLRGLAAGEQIRTVRLERPPTHASYVGEPMIEVRFEIVRELDERTFSELPVSIVGPVRATLRPGVVAVVVRGPRSSVETMEPTQVVPWVDIEDPALTGTIEPEGVEIVRVEPPSVLVALRGPGG
jgi:YbbR domain-containing protein